ncbi:hypothetical protein sscle_06g055060 [Sclerotinia sclerotiorum 1980 UF-70]|uniref:Methyltransferase domain-containing protein n=1 Tax=Sclerotinia sclerotiorum (strain ATCC 18683 / 1980 / Ss-1) TaxID=665079 RepID=A0A1D9Q764_SCLS1|nr:hypothetical protein sscle_06g055060 [Sclerotinia sclerotiorum 1980 UF-70]
MLFGNSSLGKLLANSRLKAGFRLNSQADATKPSVQQTNSTLPQFTQNALQKDISDDYVLKRDYVASCRLNLQQYLWKDTLGFTLHPNINPDSLGPAPRIADIATGTGIWLLETRKMFQSSAQLDGFDIDLGQASHAQWMPSNVTLRKWNMFEDVPSDLIGVYDVIHIRLVMLVIKDNNPLPLIRNLRKMLKPGGYLQWDEVDQMGKQIVKVSKETRSDGINKMFRVDIPEGVKGSDDWQRDLSSMLASEGFNSVQRYQFDPPATTVRYWHDMYSLAWDEFLTNTLGPKAQQALVVADEGSHEARNGAAISMPILVWVAQAC